MVFEWYYRVRDNYRFSPRELKQIIISSIIFGFMLSFRKWGGETFNVSIGITSWVMATMFIFIAIFWNVSWQKIFAINDGYFMHYHWWFPGILLGFFITFLTRGHLPLLYPGNPYFEHSKKLRLGRFRHGNNIKDFAVASVAGVLSNIVLALLLSFIYIPTKNPWIKLFIIINFLYAFFAMMPVPKIQGTKMGAGSTSGFYIFFFGRPLYFLILIGLIVYSGLIYLSATAWNSVLLLLISAIIGVIGMFIFLKMVEEMI